MSLRKREARIRAANQAASSKSTEAQLDQMAAGFGDASKPRGFGAKLLALVIGNKAVLVGLIALLGGGIGFGVCQIVRYQLRTIPGVPIGELIATSPQGDTVILIDHVALGGGDNNGQRQQPTSKGNRLTAVDAVTGKQLAVSVTDHSTCWAGGPRVWCVDEYGQVILLDPRTLATVHTAKDLIAAAKLALPTDRYERAGDEVIVHLSDGRGAQISPSTFIVTPLETVPSQLPLYPYVRCPTVPGVASDGVTLRLTSGTRRTLTSEPRPPAESATPAGPALTFLDGEFLATSQGLSLVLHRVSVDGAHLLTRVDGISRARWQASLGGECRHAQTAGGSLIVMTGNPQRRAIALDPETGAERWQFGR